MQIYLPFIGLFLGVNWVLDKHTVMINKVSLKCQMLIELRELYLLVLGGY